MTKWTKNITNTCFDSIWNWQYSYKYQKYRLMFMYMQINCFDAFELIDREIQIVFYV